MCVHTGFFRLQVFDAASTQDTIFETVAQPIAERFIDGYNGTIFAYGQTGSGKTYTIEGSARRFNQRGLIPRVISFIYGTMEGRTEEDWHVEVSFMEVYQDTGYDLLNPGSQGHSLMVKLPKVRASGEGLREGHVQEVGTTAGTHTNTHTQFCYRVICTYIHTIH